MSTAVSAVSAPAPARTFHRALRAVELLLFAAVPLVLLGVLVADFATGFHTFDFHTFWEAGRAVLHGRSPYPDSLPAVAQRTTFRPFVYPAPAAVAMAPFGLLPLTAADALFFLLGIGAVVFALRLLDVRDWRCYGAAFASFPVFAALGNGAISALLVLGVAALWRLRERPVASGAVLAALVAAKLFLWPVGIWLLATRRVRATVASAVVGLVTTATAWALIGFAGLAHYPKLLDRLTALVGAKSFSVYALVISLGGSAGAARVVTAAGGAAILAAVAVIARAPDGDRRAFTLALAAALVVSPVVWPHYLALLFVPAALASRRVSPAWLAPLGLWFFATAWSNGNAELIVPTLAVTAYVCAATARRPAPV